MTILTLLISILTLITMIYLLIQAKRSFSINIEEELKKNSQETEKIRQQVSDEISRNRKEFSENFKDLRKELTDTLTNLSRASSEIQKGNFDTFANTLKNISDTQLKNLENMSKTLNELIKVNTDRFQEINKTLKDEIRFLEKENSAKLEEMRKTVDEKLQTTLEKRINESFQLVHNQLEKVYKSIGEMQKLALDVGDLKRVLTNVKSRGVFGELQLKNLLEDILTKEQYEENAKIKKNYAVEFAIKIPSKEEDGKHVLLPIDSKFPREDYEKILDAQQKADSDALNLASKALAERIKTEAKDIKEKYLNPPETTDFAIMFLPVEGLFAEVLRIPGLFEKIRKEYNVVITGPTTITAILNSLQMGFRTLAIEKHSLEVWKILGAVKTEFEKFGLYLAKTKKKLHEAADSIEQAEKRTFQIGKKLKNVERIDSSESEKLLDFEEEEKLELEDQQIERTEN